MISFFDVDYTLLRRSSGRHFLIAGVRRGLFPIGSLYYLPSIYLRYRYGRLEPDSSHLDFRFMRGISRAALEEIAAESFPRMIQELYPGAATLVAELRSAGREVTLATSSLDLIVRPLAEHLGAGEVIASSLEYADGLSTGRFQGLPLFKEEKTRQVLAFLRKRGIAAGDCSFYTDSIHDLSLLEAVGEPVAVNPDLRLARAARRRGWRIIRF